jgi:hypothetical protein
MLSYSNWDMSGYVKMKTTVAAAVSGHLLHCHCGHIYSQIARRLLIFHLTGKENQNLSSPLISHGIRHYLILKTKIITAKVRGEMIVAMWMTDDWMTRKYLIRSTKVDERAQISYYDDLTNPTPTCVVLELSRRKYSSILTSTFPSTQLSSWQQLPLQA